MEVDEIYSLSTKYSFSLPEDEKIIELIRNPFYLCEYLKFYNDKESLDYFEFKNKLWDRNIKKTKPSRETCFLNLAFESASKGLFFLHTTCDIGILDKLIEDGILGYESSGYFITHDIYEEWALEKKIEVEFYKRLDCLDFFNSIGQSLPIRRSFRNWLSEKLLLENPNIKQFIEESITNDKVEPFWKDEIYTSVLLSNYSRTFFRVFNDEILANDQKILKRLTFILRIACKEIDYNSLSQLLGIENRDILSLEVIYIKPKGCGWKDFIEYLYENIDVIGIKNIDFALPIIYDWNKNNKNGNVTKTCSIIALKYYQWLLDNSIHIVDKDTKKQVLETISFGAAEIKGELIKIFEKILQNNWKNYGNPYYDLLKTILEGFEGFQIITVLPQYVIKVAKMFWKYSAKKERDIFNSYTNSLEIEKYFGLERSEINYFPSSAYQTPVFFLLKQSPKDTMDFIIGFTNESIESYANSGFDKSVRKVKVFFDDEEKEQYCSNCLWNMYRGTSSPVSPNLLQSIHMALEKYLLEIGGKIESIDLENILFYLLRESNSASITSIVASIVLAYPNKTFNVAEVLFRTKDFFQFDMDRWLSDLSVENLYSIGYGLNYEYQIYQNERIQTCKDKHRKYKLEDCLLYYQFFKNEEVGDDDLFERRKILWGILDNYYGNISKESIQTEEDKIWRLSLARMDIRKMTITTEESKEGFKIQFNPDISPGLKEFSENSLIKSSESIKYTSLSLWAELKFRNDQKYKEYKQYERDPKLALKEAIEIIEIIEGLQSFTNINHKTESEKEFSSLYNRPIPSYVCSVLIRDYFSDLNSDEREFCKRIILGFAQLSITPGYQYQISDGVEPAISLLPRLFSIFPNERCLIKKILFLSLFSENPGSEFFIGGKFNSIPTNAIRDLWINNPIDSKSIMFGYLSLGSKYYDLIQRVRNEHFRRNIFNINNEQIIAEFWKENQKEINEIIQNKFEIGNSIDFQKCDLFLLKNTFQLLPSKIEDDETKNVALNIISVFADKLSLQGGRDHIAFEIEHGFLESYARVVLNLNMEDVNEFIEPFVNKFNTSEYFKNYFNEFVYAENASFSYDQFWIVWNKYKEKIIEFSQKGENNGYLNKIIKSYLLASPYWKKNATEWHTLKENDKEFFSSVSKEIGPCPSALYAILKLLNGIGSNYIDDGVIWIYNILNRNNDLANMELETDTIYYLENVIRKYMFRNREQVKRTRALKNKVVHILNFLVDKGSVVGFLIRDSIL